MQAQRRFEELDSQSTPLGERILRRRILPSLDDTEVYEIILGDDTFIASLSAVFTTCQAAPRP